MKYLLWPKLIVGINLVGYKLELHSGQQISGHTDLRSNKKIP